MMRHLSLTSNQELNRLALRLTALDPSGDLCVFRAGQIEAWGRELWQAQHARAGIGQPLQEADARGLDTDFQKLVIPLT